MIPNGWGGAKLCEAQRKQLDSNHRSSPNDPHAQRHTHMSSYEIPFGRVEQSCSTNIRQDTAW
jgi:hypothetical protein